VQGSRWRTSYEREGTCYVPSISTKTEVLINSWYIRDKGVLCSTYMYIYMYIKLSIYHRIHRKRERKIERVKKYNESETVGWGRVANSLSLIRRRARIFKQKNKIKGSTSRHPSNARVWARAEIGSDPDKDPNERERERERKRKIAKKEINIESKEKSSLPLSCTAPPASPRHPNPPPLRESGSSLKRHALADHRIWRCLRRKRREIRELREVPRSPSYNVQTTSALNESSSGNDGN